MCWADDDLKVRNILLFQKFKNLIVSTISLRNHLYVIYVFTIENVRSHSKFFHLSLPSVLTGIWVFRRIASGIKWCTKSENPLFMHVYE